VWRVKPAQIVRCIAELLEHSGILKCPGGKVAAAAERDRSDNWTIACEIINTRVRDNCLRCSEGQPNAVMVAKGSVEVDRLVQGKGTDGVIAPRRPALDGDGQQLLERWLSTWPRLPKSR
jgi:hypothetical protein